MDAMKLDQAVAELLHLDPAQTTVSSAGGGGCSSASTAKITTADEDGTEKQYFMKSGSGEDAEIMFRGEHASLNALHDAVPSLCPKSNGWGKFSSSASTFFLITDFVDLTSRARRRSTAIEKSQKPASLAQKLARLHTTPAPTPSGYASPVFGFPVTTCCGDTPQDNSFCESWSEFFAEKRLRFIVGRCGLANGRDAELAAMVETTAAKVVPRLLGDEHLNGGRGVMPVVVHGDLWSGNAGKGVVSGGSGPEVVEDIVYDPSACYAHSEYELGIMNMFGGFGGSFLKEYHGLCRKTEPEEEYDDRVKLYELYHHLNHHALFGGGYRSGAINIMQGLISKYGH